MSDELYEQLMRYPRTLEEAFGPHTSREIQHDDAPRSSWRAIAIEALYYVGAAALIAAMATAPHWWRWWSAALHP